MTKKTHSGAKKRVKITGGKKVKMQKSCKNHLLSSKSSRQKKLARGGILVPTGAKKNLLKLLKK